MHTVVIYNYNYTPLLFTFSMEMFFILKLSTVLCVWKQNASNVIIVKEFSQSKIHYYAVNVSSNKMFLFFGNKTVEEKCFDVLHECFNLLKLHIVVNIHAYCVHQGSQV